MISIRKLLFLLAVACPLASAAGLNSESIPGNTIWYVHANLAQMRNAEPGKLLYDWMDGEVFLEIHEEIGIDIGKEVDSLTAFSSTDNHSVIVVEGNISQATQEKTLAIAVLKAELEHLSHEGTTYYHVRNINGGDGNTEDTEDTENSRRNRHKPLSDFRDGAYFAFIGNSKLIVTSRENELKAMLDNDGRIAGGGSHKDALFVLTADKAFVQAGLKTNEFARDEDGWQSNIIRNTEQAAILVSGMNDLIAVEAQLISTEASMAQSIGGIVNGLISLQAFNTDLDTRLRNVLENTTVKVNENILSITTLIDPALIVSALDDKPE